jgi:hypothetical protein
MKSQTADAPRSDWFWRITIRFLVGIVILLACVLLLRSCLVQFGGRNLAVYEAESDQNDPGWRWEDILKARTPVPEEENAAVRVLAAGQLIPKNWLRKIAQTDSANSTEPLELRLRTRAPNQRFSDALAAELRAELAPLPRAVGEARKVADLPRGRYEIEWQRNLFATLLPHVEPIRTVAELIAMDVLLRIHDGDVAGALWSWRALLNTGRSLGDEPLLISQLVRIAVVFRAVETLERVLAQSTLPEDELATLSVLIQAEEEGAPKLLYQVTRAERAALARTLELAGNGEIDLQQLEGGRPGGSGVIEQALSWPVIQPLIRYGEAPTLELMTRYLKDLSLPPAERRAALAKVDQELKQMKADFHKHAHMLPAMLLLPALSRVVEAFDRYQAVLRCALVALALERYRLANGRWPDTLEALSPVYLSKVPADPFSSGTLRYLRLKKNVVVYSVGVDGVDDGGAIDWTSTKSGTDLGFRLWDPARRGVSPGTKPSPK